MRIENLKKIEFGEIAELRKEKFNPEKSNEIKLCLELEHFEQVTGKINGFVYSSEQKSIKNVFHKGDVLFGKLRPYLRKYWLAEFDGICSSEVWVLRPKSKDISNEYLFNLIQTNDFIQAANVSSGSKMPRADWDYIVNFPLLIINSLSEQKAIAKCLSTWDDAIQKAEQLITLKELQKKWLMQNLLTGKKRLKGFSGEWKEVRISDCLSRMANGITYDTEKRAGIPVTRIETISDGVINFNKIGFADSTDNIEDYRLLKGDILYSHINSLAHIGKVAIYNDEKPLYHGMNLLLLRCNEHVNSFFFYQWLVSENGRKRAVNLAKPAVNQASISTSELRKISFSIPTIKEQTYIARVLQEADKEISLLKAKADKLKEEKKGLMQQLLTGKKRLKGVK